MSTLNSDKAWEKYGKNNPYYGVLAHDKFLNKNISDEDIDDFFRQGFSDVNNIFKAINKDLVSDFKPKTILDFGCGTGRLVIPFSERAEKVVGIDISTDIISVAKKNCDKQNIKNVEFFLSDDCLSNISNQKFDLINSYIVLQHINVKRGEKLIKEMIKLLNPKGVGSIQLTYYSEKERFEKKINFFRYRIPFFNNFLNLMRKKEFSLPLMQMNSYDMNEVLYLLQKEGITKTQINFTDHSGYLGLTLLFQKN
jgi:ubiquinone/menaquinone biosynthesis C-methylase UbiE